MDIMTPSVFLQYGELQDLFEKATRQATPQASADSASASGEPVAMSSTTENHAIFTHLYKNIFSQGHGIWLWETDTGTLHFDNAYMEMLGYNVDEFPDKIETWINLLHDEDREITISTQHEVLESPHRGDTFESRFRMRMKDGNYRWIIGKGVVVRRNEQGMALRLVGVHIDLVALDSTLQQHLTQHDRMHFALEAAKDGLWDWDSQSNGVYYSPRYLEMLGYTPENFLPVLDSWACRVHPDDLGHTVEMQLAVASSPKHGDMFECIYRFLAADGSYKWLLGRGKVIRRDEAGKATRIVGLHTDITELRNAQEALAKLVNTDPLTSLHSRFYLEAEFAKLRPANHPLSVIYCDVDCLKLVNDHMGHNAGDALLTKAAQLVRSSIRKTDIAARMGGDEFMILLARCPAYAAKNMLNILRQNIEHYNTQKNVMPVYMSLGTVTTEKHIPQHKLVAMADKEMMLDKKTHRAKHREGMRAWLEKQLKMPIDITDDRL